jgi:ABC-type glycerol-3-phosphate transport system permease component
MMNWMLFMIILPLFIAVVAPFFIILKIALRPEALATSRDHEFIIKPFDQSTQRPSAWEIHKGYIQENILNLNGQTLSSISWDFDSQDSFLYWNHPYKQNLMNFDKIILDIATNTHHLVIGFTDIHDHNVVADVTIKPGHEHQSISIPLNKFDLTKIDVENVKNIFILITEPAKGTLLLEKIVLKYRSLTLANFKDVLSTAFFGRYFINSVFISIIVMLGNIIFSMMAGFAFAARSFPLRRTFFLATVMMIMIPMQVLMIPTFILVQNLGWLNTYKALTIPFLLSPMNIFIMKEYISKIPRDYAEAALVDGASYFTIFFKIILPMCKPAIAVVGINTFVTCWNSFLYPFILTNTAQMRTLPVGLALYIGLFDLDWSHLMAASSLSALPVLVVFFCFQNQIIEGMLYGRIRHI